MEDAVSRLAEAITRGDAGGAAALHSDDAKLLTPAAELLTGQEAVEGYWRAGIALGLSRLELETVELEVSDAIAVEIGRYALVLESDAAEWAVDRGKYLVLHRQEIDGSWRRAVDVFNPDAPQATTSTGGET